ncbi:MAG TPA: aminotransferase class I/II-fold pyridoxal phosphate-dependent enzyme [Streptosporangiaceae bacterium]
MNILVRYRLTGHNAKEISASVEDAVRSGGLAPGDQLPPVRSLAQELGVSPTTVAAAYRELRQRGITTGAGRGGTRVRPAPPVTIRGYPKPPEGTRDLLTGAPDPALLPALPPRPRSTRLYAEAQVAPRLRRLATDQFTADGIDAAHLAVTGGALDAIERVLGTWLSPGDRVVVEDPGHVVTRDLIAAMGLVAVPVPVDEYGALPGSLAAALDAGADAAIFTPRAQPATGAAWDAGRAAGLAGVLRQHPSAVVIEDDHAGPLAGADAHTVTHGLRRWVSVRSVSKSLGPDLRLAVLAGDEGTVARVNGRQALGTGWVSYQLQETVADLWSAPAWLHRAARVYTERRDALRTALAAHDIAVIGGRSGFTCWIPVTDEGGVAAALAEAGWAVAPGWRFRIASPPGVRVCFASLEPADAERFASAFAAANRYRPARID